MNKEAWLKFVKVSKEPHHIREIFNGTFQLINDPKVQAIFFDQIDKLSDAAKGRRDPETLKILDNLREDIEDEIEFGEMQKKEILKRGPIRMDKTPMMLSSFLKILDSIRGDINELEDEIQKALKEAIGEV